MTHIKTNGVDISMTRICHWSIVICFFILFLPACTPENNSHDDFLTIYQKKLTNYQTRQGVDYTEPNLSIDILKPVSSNESTIPAMDITIDPNTGNKVVTLSLDEIIQRALANSPEIRVVSFDPTISNLEITKSSTIQKTVFTSPASQMPKALTQV